MYNAVGAEQVRWFMDGNPVRTGADGYYTLTGSGLLKAVVSWEDGTEDVLIKQIVVKE